MHRIFLFFLLLLASPATAAPDLSKLPEVVAAEQYLNGITTMQSRFIQTAHNGQRLPGTFLLKRPGKMRFEYDPPIADFIVADGLFVYYYDAEMKQQSNTPIRRSLANFFLQDELKLSGDIHVSKVTREEGQLFMTLMQKDEPLAGSLTLVFSENPMVLKKWRVVDAQGLITEIDLFSTETNLKLKDRLFYYYDPKRKEPR